MTTRLRPLTLLFAAGLLGLTPRASAGEPMAFPPETTPIQEDANNQLPKLLRRVDPVYPERAKAKGTPAQVWVAFVVDQKGAVEQPRAMFGHFPEFEQAAVDAVKQWQFSPGKHEGYHVKTQMVVQLEFTPPPRP